MVFDVKLLCVQIHLFLVVSVINVMLKLPFINVMIM